MGAVLAELKYLQLNGKNRAENNVIYSLWYINCNLMASSGRLRDLSLWFENHICFAAYILSEQRTPINHWMGGMGDVSVVYLCFFSFLSHYDFACCIISRSFPVNSKLYLEESNGINEIHRKKPSNSQIYTHRKEPGRTMLFLPHSVYF